MIETRRLPGSGAGPSPDRLLIGSEGILGIITQAWMRLQDRPKFRAGGAVQFTDFFTAARALRAISQAGLFPANCRILDPQEAFNTGAADGSVAILVLAFESGDHPIEPWMARALECCADHGGKAERADTADAHREGAAGAWRNAFIRMPYARERTIERGIINDTFETAITWDRFEVIPRQGQGRDRARDFGGDWANRPSDLPMHPCLSGRAGALFYVPCRWAAWRVDRAVAYHQVGRPRCRDRERWHSHSPSCGRARPSAVVRSPASTIVCRCPQGGQGDLGSAWLAQSGRADRSLDREGSTDRFGTGLLR